MKQSTQEFVEVVVDPQGKDDILQDYREDIYEEDKQGDELCFLARTFSKPSNWSTLSLSKWGPHSLPYYRKITKKLSNRQILALMSSEFQRSHRIPQGCRRNSV